MLGGLHGDRIDLGIGRAAGTDPLTIFALQRDRRQRAARRLPRAARRAARLLRGRLPARPPVRAARAAARARPGTPTVWLLGSSPQSAIWAAELGLPYAFADFINPGGGASRAALPRALQAGASGWSAAQLSVAVCGVCAETDEEAERLASSGAWRSRSLRRGQFGRCRRREKALRFLASASAATVAGRRGVVGSPETVRPRARADRGRLRRRRGDRGHDHPRPRRPAPLLRADRRGVRARRRRGRDGPPPGTG